VFAVVLIVDNGFDSLEARGKSLLRIDALRFGAIGIGTPSDICCREIGPVDPDLFINQGL